MIADIPSNILRLKRVDAGNELIPPPRHACPLKHMRTYTCFAAQAKPRHNSD